MKTVEIWTGTRNTSFIDRLQEMEGRSQHWEHYRKTATLIED